MTEAHDHPPPSPLRRDVVSVPVSVVSYDSVVRCVVDAAQRSRPYLVTALAVHGVIETRRRRDMSRAIAGFDIVTPDGQPVRLALNLLYRAGLADRVYGPTLMLKICDAAASLDLPVYLYGSTSEVVSALARNLSAMFPRLRVAGAEPSLFRPLEPEDSIALAGRIRASGARIVFVGLGCPRQELFAADHRDIIGLPQICVGAAFDFHAGQKRQAPRWMQDHALEWLYRLSQEPRRLFRRYAVTNSIFLVALARQWARRGS